MDVVENTSRQHTHSQLRLPRRSFACHYFSLTSHEVGRILANSLQLIYKRSGVLSIFQLRNPPLLIIGLQPAAELFSPLVTTTTILPNLESHLEITLLHGVRKPRTPSTLTQPSCLGEFLAKFCFDALRPNFGCQ